MTFWSKLIKSNFVFIYALFFVASGVNHLVMPDFYLPLIPEYIPSPEFVNLAAGVVEIVFGVGLMIRNLRFYSSLGIIILLLSFIPSHIYFIQMGSCVEGSLCVPSWLSWVRLIVIHPFLIWLAWKVRV